MVANLAKEGCEAIGADPVLAYASGLYHDIGKVLRPDYFVENQRPGHNRHDKLLPSIPVPISLVLSSAPIAVLLDHSSTPASTRRSASSISARWWTTACCRC